MISLATNPRTVVRNHLVVSSAGSAEDNYRVGAFSIPASTEGEEAVSVPIIAIAVVQSSVLVAVPSTAWHRLQRQRVLPANSLFKASRSRSSCGSCLRSLHHCERRPDPNLDWFAQAGVRGQSRVSSSLWDFNSVPNLGWLRRFSSFSGCFGFSGRRAVRFSDCREFSPSSGSTRTGGAYSCLGGKHAPNQNYSAGPSFAFQRSSGSPTGPGHQTSSTSAAAKRIWISGVGSRCCAVCFGCRYRPRSFARNSARSWDRRKPNSQMPPLQLVRGSVGRSSTF